VAKVVFENVYKSFPRRKGEQNMVLPHNAMVKIDGETRGHGEGEKDIAHQFLASTQNVSSRDQSQTFLVKSSQISILRNINLDVEDGEFMVLVGPSGCGKSTLLRLLAGLEEMTGGNIWIGDRAVNNLPPKERNIAMVFQNYALYPHLNVYDNIAFGLRRGSQRGEGRGEKGDWVRGKEFSPNSLIPHFPIPKGEVEGQRSRGENGLNSKLWEDLLVGMTRSLPRGLRYLSAKEKKIREQVRYVAQLLQIEQLLNRLPKELSGGQKQRVALGRAIARNPEVFLMDEPLSNLDAKLRAETRAQIVQLQRQLGITTIYVTHDQTEAMTMGDRIAVMNEGKIQQIAPPLEIYHHPANRFVAEFIGSPPMNFLPVEWISPLTLIHSQFCLTLPENWTEPLQTYGNKSLLLGIRPEHLYISDPGENNLPVQVNLVEALGNDTYISVSLREEPDSTLQVRIPPEKMIHKGESVWLSIDVAKIHLFAADTGQSISMNNKQLSITL
jgi:multiple sugar transport system ATP-binding protein